MFVFINLKIEIMWTSYRFYIDMMDKIKKYIKMTGNDYKIIDNIDQYTKDMTLIIDIATIINLFWINKLEKLLDTNYILIVGENIDKKINSFIGWNDLKTYLNFSTYNLLAQVLRKSKKITYQNNKLFNLFKEYGITNLQFFPIDGYLPEYVIPNLNKVTKDIDVLYYGGMCYNRRMEVATNLCAAHPKWGQVKVVVCNNIFDLNDLINRSKIILHVNSVDSCYHVPYAKIMKILANNKIIVTEVTEEFKTCDLIDYVYPFNFNDTGEFKGVKFPSYMSIIYTILENYDDEQKKLNQKNPQKYIKEHYNFNFNVSQLLDIKIPTISNNKKPTILDNKKPINLDNIKPVIEKKPIILDNKKPVIEKN